MYRKWLLLASTFTGLMLVVFVLGVTQHTAQGSVQRTATVHTVCISGNCDFASIQAAINAASAGDEIRITSEIYQEHLVITQALTLTGGWNADFSAQTDYTYLFNPHRDDPIGHGRMITITTLLSNTLVSIDRFDIEYGNATVPTQTISATAPASLPLFTFYPAQPGETPGAGTPPAGGEIEQAARLDRLRPLRGPLDGQIRLPGAGSLASDVPDPGYGGGIYVENASLHLSNSKFYRNVASDLSTGFGGALAVRNSASLVVRGCYFHRNAASSLYAGRGGAIFADGISPGGLVMVENQFISNQAGFGPDPFVKIEDSYSYGGGVGLTAAPGAYLARNLFQGNLAAWDDAQGYGGGLMVLHSPGSIIETNTFDANTSLARYSFLTGNDYGSGGGVEVIDSDSIAFTDNTFSHNVGGLYRSGYGGGLSINSSYYASIRANRFDENWAVYRNVYWSKDLPGASGGGLYLGSSRYSQVLSNTFASNRAAYWQPAERPDKYEGMGGGLYAQYGMNELLVAGNVFTANLASTNAAGYGGALALGHNSTTHVTVRANSFFNNQASQSGAGMGGAVYANIERLDLNSNLLQGNHASQSGPGKGGGVAGAAISAGSDRLLWAGLDGNRFFDNRAQADGGGSGGGIYLEGANGFEVFNNLLVNNTAAGGSGITLIGAGANSAMWRALANNTFSANPGEAVLVSGWVTAPVQVANNIIAFQDSGIRVEPPQSGQPGIEIPIDATLFWKTNNPVTGAGSYTVTHSLEADPAFLNPAAGDYHLRWGSPAQDSGHNGSPAPDHDAEGVARPFGPAWDRGAYEWHAQAAFLPLLNSGVKLVGWAAGQAVDKSGAILYTPDGGLTWMRQGAPGQWPQTQFNDVSALDEQTAWAVGRDFIANGPIIVRTQDGGKTWVRQQAPNGTQGQELSGVKAVTASTVFAVGSGGIILKTSNGQDWTLLNPGNGAPLSSWQRLDALNEQVLCAGGADVDSYAAIACSSDGGLSWQRLGDPPGFWDEHIIDVSLVNPWTIFTAGGGDMVTHWTFNGGQTWGRKALIGGFDANGIVAVDSAFAWVACDNGVMFRTADGGQTWENQPTPDTAHGYYLLGVTAYNQRVAYVVGFAWNPAPGENHSIFLVTTDGGANWRDITPPLSLVDGTFRRISFAGARR
jgi:photosystem II stability/assembly factor-like uncharacterized protein